MEQGERNLLEAMNAENLCRDMNKVRPVLEQLAKCLDHLHSDRHYVHLDFKPKNCVRESSNRQFLLADFDSSVEIGKPMGNKVSSVYIPPEMVLKQEGKPHHRNCFLYAHYVAPTATTM